jgi:hypothetical protein
MIVVTVGAGSTLGDEGVGTVAGNRTGKNALRSEVQGNAREKRADDDRDVQMGPVLLCWHKLIRSAQIRREDTLVTRSRHS